MLPSQEAVGSLPVSLAGGWPLPPPPEVCGVSACMSGLRVAPVPSCVSLLAGSPLLLLLPPQQLASKQAMPANAMPAICFLFISILIFCWRNPGPRSFPYRAAFWRYGVCLFSFGLLCFFCFFVVCCFF